MRRKQKEFLEIDGHDYYIDINAIGDIVRIEQPTEQLVEYVLSLNENQKEESKKENLDKVEVSDDNLKDNEIEDFDYDDLPNEPVFVLDTIKLEFIKMCIDTVLNSENRDGKLDFEREMSYGFKLSFNTLLKNDIIKEA
jgi:hypothetical protein